LIEDFFVQRGELENIIVAPRFEKLRQDPRYVAMLQRVGFPKLPARHASG